MKNLLCACVLFLSFSCIAQPGKSRAEKYPSLFWEITGKGLQKPSYLFGTMHVSNKMVFHLSDSFYLGIKNAQIVALETNPGTWQEDYSRYDIDVEGLRQNLNRYFTSQTNEATPQDFLTINTLKLTSFEKAMEAALYSNPSILNSFLYRSNSEMASDFEEDTYLDLHIFQTGRKLGKKVCGVENFDVSMQLVKEAYADAAKEKKKRRRGGYDDEFSYSRLEEAYRTGNLDLLDTINKVNSQSAAFDEKFLYKRNEIQAASIDSIIKTGVSLFVGVGAAHLPGERGVIELLRKAGYSLRPIRMKERDRYHKESIEKIRVPVQFTRQVAEDGFYSVLVPGKLYSFGKGVDGVEMKQFADMINGSYYMVTRIFTNAPLLGLSEAQVQKKLDSVMYENIPGKILVKKAIVKNGYRGYDLTNRTRRGDRQRYNIFVTPFEILLFKMSGNSDYVSLGTEADRFFGSIQLKETKQEWKAWSPSYGGFIAEWPHQPFVAKGQNRVYTAYDPVGKTAFAVIRTTIQNHDFVEEDSFDLALMEESFASSEGISRMLTRHWSKRGGYPTLDVRYRNRDSSESMVRFLLQGPHYYTVIASAKNPNPRMSRFLQSFAIQPFKYAAAEKLTDTSLRFRVTSPVKLQKGEKLAMYPEEAYYNEYAGEAEDSLLDKGIYKSRIIENDSTGEKIFLACYKPSSYFQQWPKQGVDSTGLYKEWVVRKKRSDTLANGRVVTETECGNSRSSRVLLRKTITKNGAGYKLETEVDTLSSRSSFISNFFNSFEPMDDWGEVDVQKKKSGLFFSQFFSGDTLLRKKAVKNIASVVMDSSDFALLRESINSLSWKEKKYLTVKKNLTGKLSYLKTGEAADFLKELYFRAGDTLELQYAALEALLGQKTAYAFQTFSEIMKTDPPVLELGGEEASFTTVTDKATNFSDDILSTIDLDGAFMDNLADSLQLTAGIMADLLPLLNIDDYEKPLMKLLGTLVDSSLVKPSVYESYLPKLLLEAKQSLKKQLIQEKTISIEKKSLAEEDKKSLSNGNREAGEEGNEKLSLYATLLLPFWDRHPQVKSLVNQLLSSSDNRLKYNTALLLLRHNRPVPDTLLSYFAALDHYRYNLYRELKKTGKASSIPKNFLKREELLRSRLLSMQTYDRPDTLVFLQTLPVQYKEQEGLLYFYKYKEKGEEGAWKLAVAGMVPKNGQSIEWEGKDEADEYEYDFTEVTGTKLNTETSEKEQLEKLLKKLLYSRRKSAAQFYVDNNRNGFDFMGMQE